MVSQNPFAEFRTECETALAHAFKTVLPEIKIENLTFSKPPNPEFGQLANSLSFELAKKLNQKPNTLAEALAKTLQHHKFHLIEKVTSTGGYVNFHLNYPKFNKLTLEAIAKLGSEYGFTKTTQPTTIIVEHTSVNPLHPIHIGQARNPMLGDALARILTARGHTVTRHYYIDDVGRQSSVVAYGYQALGKPKPDEKTDHFIGNIYTVTSCLVEINRLKKALTLAKATNNTDDITKTNKDLTEWTSIAAELQSKFPALFEKLLAVIGEEENPEEEINRLNRQYEDGEPKAKQLIREVSDQMSTNPSFLASLLGDGRIVLVHLYIEVGVRKDIRP